MMTTERKALNRIAALLDEAERNGYRHPRDRGFTPCSVAEVRAAVRLETAS